MEDQEKITIKNLIGLAEAYCWTDGKIDPKNRMMFFHRERNRITVYYTTMTIGLYISDDNDFRFQVFLRNAAMEDLEEIFINPIKIAYEIRKKNNS